MPNDAVAKFTRRLLEGTKSGVVDWEKSPAGRYTAKAGSGSVVIGHNEVDDDVWATVLEVRDENDQAVETIATEPLRPGAWRDWEETLLSLYDEARLNALGTTKVLKNLTTDWGLPADPNDIPF